MRTRAEINQLPATFTHTHGAMWCLRLSPCLPVVSKKKKVFRDTEKEDRDGQRSTDRRADDIRSTSFQSIETSTTTTTAIWEKNLPHARHLHLTASFSSPKKGRKESKKKKETTDNFGDNKKKRKKNINVFDLSFHLRSTLASTSTISSKYLRKKR